jgi:transcriptional regulator with XRE-family HTH domain
LTQEEVADILGMAVRHYQKIEAGELNITLRTLARVASAVRTSPSDLLK